LADYLHIEQGQDGVYDHFAPFLGIKKFTNEDMLKLYSMKEDRTVHVLRFTAPVIKFQSTRSSKNKLLVLLQDGNLKLFSLVSLEQEYVVKTFAINRVSLNEQAHEALREAMAKAFPLDITVNASMFAHIQNEINEEDAVEEMSKGVDGTLIG